MGDGLRKASLEALCTRGPWQTTEGPVTDTYLRGIYEIIALGQEPKVRSDRRTDRALQLLRAAGLIEFSGTPRRWRLFVAP